MSQIEGLSLPANRDNSDFVRNIPAGEEREIVVIGDFIYCKATDHEVEVIVNGKTARMQAGDVRRIGNPFRGLNIRNPNRENSVNVEFVIGFGDFDRKIIQGEITASPGIRRASGKYVDDTRNEISMSMVPIYPMGADIVEGGALVYSNELPQVFTPDQGFRNIRGPLGTWEENGNIVVQYDVASFSWTVIMTFSPDGVKQNEQLYSRQNMVSGEFRRPVRVDGTVYFIDSENPTQIRFKNDQNSFSVLALMSFDIEYMSKHDRGICVTASQGDEIAFVICSTNGDILETVRKDQVADISLLDGATPRFIQDPLTKEWAVSTNSVSRFGVWNESLTENLFYAANYFEDAGGGASLQMGSVLKANNNIYGFFAYDNFFNKWNFREKQITLSALAYAKGCSNPLANISSGGRESTAVVEVEQQDGLSVIRGQLIKAALEVYFDGSFPEDFNYLDYVYYVEVSGQNGSVAQVGKQSNGATFARIGVEDNFTATFPADITMIIDAELEIFTGVGK